MQLNDPIGPDGVAATVTLGYASYEPDETLADVLATTVAGQIQPQIDELCDDQWALLDAVGGTEEVINPAFERLRAHLGPAIAQAIADWKVCVRPKPDVVNVYGDDTDGLGWTVSGDLRTFEHPDGNHAWADEIKRRVAALRKMHNGPTSTVQYDPEHSCFFAYCETEATAGVVAAVAREVHRAFGPDIESRWTAPEHEVGYYPEN